MKLNLEEAKTIAVSFLLRHKMPADHAGIVADHLIYAALAGRPYAGFSRLLPLAERLRKVGIGGEIKILRETDKSALIDGAGVNGYVTSLMAMDKAVDLARKSGVGIVGLNNSWFSGLLRYYVERAAQADMVAIHAANSIARVAPHGGIDQLLGTNPIAFSFPTEGKPLIIDMATASVAWGDVIYHQQTHQKLAPGLAVNAAGEPTVDPWEAVLGAFMPWGGPRGSGMSVAVQALGILGGSDPIVADAGKWGYFFMAIDPSLLIPTVEFKRRMSSLRSAIEGSRPVPGGGPVRVPGAGTESTAEENRMRGWIEVADEVYDAVVTDPGA